MAKAQRFLFSFTKFMDFLKKHQDKLNIYVRTYNDSPSGETDFYLDDKLYISEENTRGQGKQYFLFDNNMVIGIGSNRSPVIPMYYFINPDDDEDIYLVHDVGVPLFDETLHPINPDVFQLLKEHGGIDKGNN